MEADNKADAVDKVDTILSSGEDLLCLMEDYDEKHSLLNVEILK